jgi:molecular chaperone GrpE
VLEPKQASEPPAGEPSELLDDARGELEAMKDRLLRLQADFENYRRRVLKEREDTFNYGHENLVKDLLAPVDNLERAIELARRRDGGDLEGFLQGVELVLRELNGILAKHGVSEIAAQGRSFDPQVHEAMAQEPAAGGAAPNTVTRVLEKGYRLRDRLLRPARVVVARRHEQEPGA